ncbi:phosphonate C-P lyase system protein PhnH [Piscinibacter sp.]|uniref:phosphonate C-P lyase system protein PhnH n=1 Tax=Piscinibacter sp. TaxID=1903157 RepID=UPI002C1EEB9E|nr:phosphonate C-P lyase system protein PhnH [Albitalea sp.]HUG21290.1 phosphonate C-P lyase system protein PhnH [Albitalea sp.]
MSAVLTEMTPGFRDAVHGAQQTFRTLLDAMSRPGRMESLPESAIEGIVPPESALAGRPMSVGTAALMLTLLDAETTVRLAGSLVSSAALSYLRFHTGVRSAWLEELAAFTAARAADVDASLWTRLDLGSDEVPQRGATLVVEVDDLGTGTRLWLRGPGIESVQPLAVAGLPRDFWLWRTRLQSLLPRGIDLVLVCGARIAAIPRSTRITLET